MLDNYSQPIDRSEADQNLGTFLNYLNLYDTGREQPEQRNEPLQPNQPQENRNDSDSKINQTFGDLVLAKRGPAPEVAPVTAEGLTFTPEYNINLNGGHFAASLRVTDPATGEERCRIPLYTIPYDQNMETDVQDVYLRSLTNQHGILVATDENGRHFKIDPRACLRF